MKVNGFTLLEIAHLSNGANIYNPKVEHLLNDKIKQAYFDGLAEGRKENEKLKSELSDIKTAIRNYSKAETYQQQEITWNSLLEFIN